MPGWCRKRGRRAQITVFLIIGLVILISSGLFFYLREIGIGDYKLMQPKSAPVEKYIETCMQQVGRSALDIVGAQGGFYEFPPEIRFDPSRYVYVVPPIAGTEDFAPRVPLWWSNGNLKIPSRIITGNGESEWIYTESEVDRYIEDNLKACFNDFQSFSNEFEFVEYTNISAYTKFNRNDVSITIDYELDIIHKGSGKITRKNQFVTRLPVKFKQMMEAAWEIAHAAVNSTFFEDATFNLMAAMPDDTPDGLPLTGVQFHCGSLHWDMFKIKEKLQDSMRIIMTGVRFDDTDHLPFREKEKVYVPFKDSFQELKTISPQDLDNKDTKDILFAHLGQKTPPSDAYEYFQLFFKFADKEDKYDDLVVGAEYRKDFGMDFLAVPSSNGRMTSSTADFRHQIMSLICLNYYHFVYRVRFPVVITIFDPEAYNGEGARFKFAYLVTIANNEPDKQPRAAEFFEAVDVAPDFCDPINLNGQPTEIIAVDQATGLELNRVNISYKCFGSLCHLGETETNNQRFQLSTNLPEGCSRGVIIAEKEGYLTSQTQVLGTPHRFEMYPTLNLSYHVMKRRSQSMHIARYLEPNEHVAIDIQSTDPTYSYFTDYDEEDRFNLTHSIDLLKSDDVTYRMSLYLFKTIGDQDILTGGWIGNWTPDLSTLKDADRLTLQVVELFPAPTSEDTDKMMQVFDLISNRSNYASVNPETQAIELGTEEETG